MPRATINEVTREFPPGLTILEACRRAKVVVPTLCHDPRLAPIGSCRLCLVEVEGRPQPLASCSAALEDGMRIHTHTAALEQHRHQVRAMIEERRLRRPVPADDSHPYIKADMSLCVECYRCVRICADLQGQFVWRVHGRGGDSRVVPDSGGPLGASRCVSCGACVDTCPTGALSDKRAGEAVSWTRTTCPYCGTGCELNAGASAAGHLVASRPVLDAPVSKGHLCVKGRYAFEFVHAPDRVTSPMIRPAGGEWKRVSWEEAIAFTAERLRDIVARHGPSAAGVLGSARGTNEENYLAQKFARLVLGTNNVDCCARVCHAPTATAMKRMLGTGAATNSYDDIERARTLLVVGANATENHPIIGARIRQAALRGALLIVIDPRVTELAAIATVHLRPRPGTDIPLLHSLAQVMIAENLYDEAFVRQRVDAFDRFAAHVAAWTPERAAAVTGVDPELVRRAARLYAGNRPAMSLHGLGITEHRQGTETVMAVVNLALLAGSFGIPGGGVNPLRGQNNVQGSAHMGCEPAHMAGYVPVASNIARFAEAWGAPVAEAPGWNMLEMIDRAAEGRLHALWAIGYDVLLTNANAAATRRALANLELLIVQDMFLNETARACGAVFLPAASSFEKDGTFMNAERRIQRVRRAIPPLGESRSDWEILCAVAAAMGHGAHFRYASAAEIWEEVRRVWPAGAGISYERLEHGGLQWPCPAEDHPGTTVLHQEAFSSGTRAALEPVPWEPGGESADPSFPFLLMTGRKLYQFNAGTMTMRTPNAEIVPGDTLDISPTDARRLGVETGDWVRLVSRYGEATLPVQVDHAVAESQLFATFHAAGVFLNQVTGPARDRYTSTPEYKVTAVRVEPAARGRTLA